MINISLARVLSLSKKYTAMDDFYSSYRIEFLTQILIQLVSNIAQNQDIPEQLRITAELEGMDIEQIATEIFKDLEIAVTPLSINRGWVVFLLVK